MKKLLLFIFILFSIVPIYASDNISDILNQLPTDFKKECYNYYGEIDKWALKDLETYKLNTNFSDLVIVQNNYVLPYKHYQNPDDIFNYEFSEFLDEINWFPYNFMSDENKETYWDFEINNWYSLELNFQEYLSDFDFYFDYDLTNFYPIFYIFKDWKYREVKQNSIKDFSFNKMKIVFENVNSPSDLIEKLTIRELSFKKNIKTILIKSFLNSKIELYSKNNCKDSSKVIFKNYDLFDIDKDTKNINLNLEINPNYDVYIAKDNDWDWVLDDVDNCIYISNPKQLDTNWDWKWDLCSDDDKDWIYWHKDNCLYTANPDQKDINRNWVWDACEFDKDWDWVFDWIDNCINTINPEQVDKDWDWIWDLCDNCNLYNPRQFDQDNNWVWDTCDEKNIELNENDDDNDGIINWKDNCKDLSNANQSDKDKDWIWDVCDNCIDLQNHDQADLDENWIWDLCEDSDKDWILWYLDNCIYENNPDQKDDDNDNIWNLCEDDDNDWILFSKDNCPFKFNKDQSDVDKDWVWDVCDEQDDRYIESNKPFFIWFLLLISIIFSALIFGMIKKLNKQK